MSFRRFWPSVLAFTLIAAALFGMFYFVSDPSIESRYDEQQADTQASRIIIAESSSSQGDDLSVPIRYRNNLQDMATDFQFTDMSEGLSHLTTLAVIDELMSTQMAAFLDGIAEQKRVPILMYHHIVTDPTEVNSAVITAEKFVEDMNALKNAGFETVFLQDLVDYVYEGTPLPEKPVAITFDDGYMSNYEYAYPVLQQLDMKATILIIGWSVGETKYKGTERDIIPHFTWEQAKEMYNSGHIDIQSHTYDMHNPYTPEQPSRRGVLQMADAPTAEYVQALTQDLNRLAALIEENIGNEVYAFAYPYGDYSFHTESILQDLGYKVTLSTQHGVQVIQQGQPQTLYLMQRINVSPDIPSDELVRMLE